MTDASMIHGAHQRPAPRAPGRRGMSLVEVIVALVILAGAMLALSRFIGTFSRTVNDSGVKSIATQLAAERLEQVKTIPTYVGVDSAALIERAIPGHANFVRQTYVRRVGGGTTADEDYKIVTVVVTSPSLRAPVKRTTVISEF